MTPKEKALELAELFYEAGFTGFINYEQYHRRRCALKCALICVDKIIEEYLSQIFRRGMKNPTTENNLSFWIDVKKEIEKL